MNSELQIQGSVGKLSAILNIPVVQKNEKYPLVILMHGLMLYKEFGMLSLLAEQLEAIGIASIRFDFNGHGQSEGKFENMTILNEIEDAAKVFDSIKKMPQIKSISLLGHSQGGIVASMLAGQLGTLAVKGLVLLAPAAVYKDQALNGSILGVQFDAHNIPDYIEAYDHKVGRTYLKTAQELEIYETAGKYQGPVCIVQGKIDGLVPYIYAKRFKDIYKQCELHLLENENHFFTHDKDAMIRLVLDFLKRITL